MNRYLIGYMDKSVFFVVQTVYADDHLHAAIDYARQQDRMLVFYSSLGRHKKFMLKPEGIDDKQRVLYVVYTDKEE